MSINRIAGIILFLCIPRLAAADLTAEIPQNMTAAPSSHIIVPISLTGTAGKDIGGYMLRLDYDESILLNPQAIHEGTLSENHPDLIFGAAQTSAPWTFSVAIGFSFSVPHDGDLVKLRFFVSPEFSGSTSIQFHGPNTESCFFVDLMKTEFERKIIPARFISGSISASPPEIPPPVYPSGDFNKDMSLDSIDIEMFRNHWLLSCRDLEWDRQYDLRPDCIVDVFDLAEFADYF